MKPTDLEKVATSLAAASRLVRKAADEHDAVLQKLRDVSAHATAEQAAADAAARHERLKEIQPFIDAGAAVLAEARAARAAAEATVEQFDGIDWPTIVKKFGHRGVDGLHSHGTRIAALRTTVNALADHLTASSEKELADVIDTAKALADVKRVEETYVVNNLRHVTRNVTGGAEAMRLKTAAIAGMVKNLSDIFTAPTAQEGR